MTLPYLRKSGSYRYVSPQNISQISEESHRSINGLSGFEDWTENPRVGGSIPPLATILTTLIRSIFPRAAARVALADWQQLLARTENPRVGSSILSLATVKSKRDALD